MLTNESSSIFMTCMYFVESSLPVFLRYPMIFSVQLISWKVLFSHVTAILCIDITRLLLFSLNRAVLAWTKTTSTGRSFGNWRYALWICRRAEDHEGDMTPI